MTARIWLPERRRLAALVERVPMLRAVLARADRLPDRSDGAPALIRECFAGFESSFPEAALTRRIDAPDDHGGRWLRVDPCHLRVEVSGVRMLACGPGLELDADESAALAATVRPLFEEAGWRFDARTPDRWYAAPSASDERLGGDPPELALGAFIDRALPAGDAARATRRWLNELQMALHQHPVHRERIARGRFEVNSLWLHGDGVAPSTLDAAVGQVRSADPRVQGCAAIAGIETRASLELSAGAWLCDARDALADPAPLAEVLAAAQPMLLQLESGERFSWRPWHRLRLWRREPE